jgi:hypothetical protein
VRSVLTRLVGRPFRNVTGIGLILQLAASRLPVQKCAALPPTLLLGVELVRRDSALHTALGVQLVNDASAAACLPGLKVTYKGARAAVVHVPLGCTDRLESPANLPAAPRRSGLQFFPEPGDLRAARRDLNGCEPAGVDRLATLEHAAWSDRGTHSSP